MQGNVLEQTGGGGDKINGIIQEAITQGVVNAGEFVKLVDKFYPSSEDTYLNTDRGVNKISAVTLSENKVFIVYGSTETSGVILTNYRLYGMVCTINDSNIIVGTTTQISSVAGSGYYFSAVALDENTIFIAHRYGSSNKSLYGIACKINGISITIGTETAIDDASSVSSFSVQEISATFLNDNSGVTAGVFIAYSRTYGTSYTESLSFRVCRIGIRDLSVQTGDARLISGNYYGIRISTVTIASNVVFIAHSSNSNGGALRGLGCTISGLTVTTGTDTELISNVSAYTNNANVISATVIPKEDETSIANTGVFIVHCNNTTEYKLNGIFCLVNGTASITVKGDSNLVSTEGSGHYASAVTINRNKVFVAHQENEKIYRFICDIDYTSSTVSVQIGTNIEIASSYSPASYDLSIISSTVLSESKIFTIHQKNNKIYGIICNKNVGSIKNLESSDDEIFGIAKTKGTDGQTVKVIIPEEVA